MTKKLWTFNWVGGGYNQVYATSRKDALAEVDRKFDNDPRWSSANVCNLYEVKDETAFWRNYPLFD